MKELTKKEQKKIRELEKKIEFINWFAELGLYEFPENEAVMRKQQIDAYKNEIKRIQGGL